MIEIGMGSVQTGECDVMEHMNVRHYVSRGLEAMAWLGLELGLGPAHARGHAAGLVPADQHIRFLRELPAGAPLSVWGGVVGVRGRRLRLYQEIRNTAADQVAATLVADAALVDLRTGEARPLPPGIGAAAATAPFCVCVSPSSRARERVSGSPGGSKRSPLGAAWSGTSVARRAAAAPMPGGRGRASPVRRSTSAASATSVAATWSAAVFLISW